MWSPSYSRWAVCISLRREAQLRPASCASVAAMNGAYGLRVQGFSSALRTWNGASTQALGEVPAAGLVEVHEAEDADAVSLASRSQYDALQNAIRSCS